MSRSVLRIWPWYGFTLGTGRSIPLEGTLSLSYETADGTAQVDQYDIAALMPHSEARTGWPDCGASTDLLHFSPEEEPPTYYNLRPVEEAIITTPPMVGRVEFTSDFQHSSRGPFTIDVGHALGSEPKARSFAAYYGSLDWQPFLSQVGLWLRNHRWTQYEDYYNYCNSFEEKGFRFVIEFAPYVGQIEHVFENEYPLGWEEEADVTPYLLTDFGDRIDTTSIGGRNETFRVRIEPAGQPYARLVKPDGQTGDELDSLSAEEYLEGFSIIYDEEHHPPSADLFPIPFTTERLDDPSVSRTDTIWAGGYKFDVAVEPTTQLYSLIDTVRVTVTALDYTFEPAEEVLDLDMGTPVSLYGWGDGQFFGVEEDSSGVRYVPLERSSTGPYRMAPYRMVREGNVAFVAYETPDWWGGGAYFTWIETNGPRWTELQPYWVSSDGEKYWDYPWGDETVYIRDLYFTVQATPDTVATGDTTRVAALAKDRDEAGFNPDFAVDLSLDDAGAGRLVWQERIDTTWSDVASGASVTAVPYEALDAGFGDGTQQVVFVPTDASAPPPAAVLAPPQNKQQVAQGDGSTSLFTNVEITATRADDPDSRGEGKATVFLAGVFAQFLAENPYALLDIPCSEIPEYVSLAEHTAPQSVLDRLNGGEFALITPDGLTSAGFHPDARRRQRAARQHGLLRRARAGERPARRHDRRGVLRALAHELRQLHRRQRSAVPLLPARRRGGALDEQ